jgi:tol-pal system protein YbgF
MLMPRSQSSAAPAGRATASGAASPDLALPPPEGRGRDAEREAYREAFDLLKQRRYDDAAAAFRALLSRYPRGELADNARYWLGETYYVKRDYAAALAEFQRVLDDYPLSPKVAGSMLKIGYIQDERKEWPRARTTLERLIDKFPDSTEARLAQGRLERMARDGH